MLVKKIPGRSRIALNIIRGVVKKNTTEKNAILLFSENFKIKWYETIIAKTEIIARAISIKYSPNRNMKKLIIKGKIIGIGTGLEFEQKQLFCNTFLAISAYNALSKRRGSSGANKITIIK
jgi:hypothetical protein